MGLGWNYEITGLMMDWGNHFLKWSGSVRSTRIGHCHVSVLWEMGMGNGNGKWEWETRRVSGKKAHNISGKAMVSGNMNEL
jgi:hypothetical protein